MKSPPISPLEAHLGYWLRFVSNHVSLAFAQKLEGHAVTVAEWVVLRELYDRDVAAPSDLADQLGLTRGAISKLVERLVEKGFIDRTADTSDKRFQALRLTSTGRALVPKLSALADTNDAEFFGHLAAKDRALIEKLMRDIIKHHELRSVPIA